MTADLVRGTIAPMPAPRRTDYLTFDDIAARTGLAPATVRWRHRMGFMPPPDIVLGRTPGWLPETINRYVEAWEAGTFKRPKATRHRPPYLDSEAAAERIGVSAVTWRSYHRYGRTPPPDIVLGESAGWLPATVDGWHASRPGPGGWAESRERNRQAREAEQ